MIEAPNTVCIDPTHPSISYYIGALTSIRFVNTDTDTVSLFAGSGTEGFADGIGSAAAFHTVQDMKCTRDGARLFVSDQPNNRIRMVDVKTQTVSTIAGDGRNVFADGIGLRSSIYRPQNLVFDRSRSTKPESVLYITCEHGIARFDLTTSELCIASHRTTNFKPCAIDATPSGQLIVGCLSTNSIYSVDPLTGEDELLAGAGTENECTGSGTGGVKNRCFVFRLR